ncbi:unnamed protein product [Mytilus coruscus]|uniref:Uncharacterized protein n=1 Tax=Mytilus coruscus TaxID=42192 RepID=A0A6J8CFK6_MYTCO|nr:unnamed protein product [Mytilus coruscus]
MYLIFQQNSNSSPFGNLSLVGIPDSRYIPTCPARSEVSLNFNKQPAMIVDLTNIGGIDAHSTQKQSASQTRNDFMKDNIPVERLSKLFDTIIQVELALENVGKVYVRTVASVIGQIISMSYVIGNVAYIMTKYISIDVMSACSWKSDIELSVQSKKQLIFWRKKS